MQSAIGSFLLLSWLAAPAPEGAKAPADPWAAWAPLVGEWVGEGAGRPGSGGGGFSFERSLDGRVLVRKSFSEYPATKDRPATRHEDLMVVYHDGAATRADYWDNEGHVIRYGVTFPTPTSIVLTSDPAPGAPRFRLTYAWTTPGRVTIDFAMAPPGAPEQFGTYVSGTARRKSRPRRRR